MDSCNRSNGIEPKLESGIEIGVKRAPLWIVAIGVTGPNSRINSAFGYSVLPKHFPKQNKFITSRCMKIYLSCKQTAKIVYFSCLLNLGLNYYGKRMYKKLTRSPFGHWLPIDQVTSRSVGGGGGGENRFRVASYTGRPVERFLSNAGIRQDCLSDWTEG